MKYIGILVVVLTLLGLLNIIDFHVCISAPGGCSKPRAVIV